MPGGDDGFYPSLDASDDHDEFDLQQLKELAGYLVRAPRRHLPAAILSLCFTLTLGFLGAAFWPRSYRCDLRMLARNNLVLPALGNPNRAVPRDADAPTKNAADAILRRDNIVAMIEQLDLVNRWQATRQPILRLKDRITGVSKSEDERLRDMIEIVGSRLAVVSDDSSITLSIVWPDRQIAFEILSFLQRNFIEARYNDNVSVIVEAIRILEERSKPQAAEVDTALAELLKCEAEHNVALGRVPGNVEAAPPGPPLSPSRVRANAPTSVGAVALAPAPVDGGNDGGTTADQLRVVRRRSQLLKDDLERQRAEAQRQLVDARATLGPLHPTVVALNDKISQLNEPAPELQALDERERTLVSALAGAGTRPSAAPSNDPPASGTPTRAAAPLAAAARRPIVSSASTLPEEPRDDSRTALARAKLQTASTKYSELLSRIEAAKMELDVTRAAFKFQYIVVRPPELPRGPSKPNVRLVVLATVVLSFIMAMLVPAALDFGRGRFVESWQIERKLKLPLLGRLAPPS